MESIALHEGQLSIKVNYQLTFMDVSVAFHNRIETSLMNAIHVHSKERRLEK